MNLHDLRLEMVEMERKLEVFHSTYDMEVMVERKREYRRIRYRRKNAPSSTPELMIILKEAHSCCCRFDRLQKKLNDIMKDVRIIENGCMNCHRRDPQGENSCAAPYSLSFRKLP